MKVDIHTGVLVGARHVPSPNCDARPATVEPELIVIHNISLPPSAFGTPWIEKFFCNELDADAHPYFKEICDMQVSAHILIRRDGEVVQFVPFMKRAWHAGQSSYQGRECCNDFSIGIELEGTDHIPYENKQYEALGRVISTLLRAYPSLSAERIVGHSDIAPGRKTDPGPAFDWQRLDTALNIGFTGF